MIVHRIIYNFTGKDKNPLVNMSKVRPFFFKCSATVAQHYKYMGRTYN